MDEKIAYLEKLRVAFRAQRGERALRHQTARSAVETARRDGWMEQILKLVGNTKTTGLLVRDLSPHWPKAVSGLRTVLQAMVAEGCIAYITEPDDDGKCPNRRRYFHPKFAPKGALTK